jgi:hypothetical protein
MLLRLWHHGEDSVEYSESCIIVKNLRSAVETSAPAHEAVMKSLLNRPIKYDSGMTSNCNLPSGDNVMEVLRGLSEALLKEAKA